MSTKVRLIFVGGQLQIWLQIYTWIVLQSHLCITWALCGGSTLDPDPDPAPDPYLGFTPDLAPVPSLSQLGSLLGGLLHVGSTPLFCLQTAFWCMWLDRIITFGWPMSQKPNNLPVACLSEGPLYPLGKWLTKLVRHLPTLPLLGDWPT